MLDAHESRISLKLLAVYLVIIIVSLGAVVAVLVNVFSDGGVSDFTSCAQAGGEVQEQFPRRCVYRSTTYVEELDVQEIEGDRDDASDQITRTTIIVGARYLPCSDDEDQECLDINGEPFSGEIEGYEYREGDIRKMIVQAITRNGDDEPYRYIYEDTVSSHYLFTPEPIQEPIEEELVEQAPEPVEPTTQEMTMSIGRFVLECDETPNGVCLVVDDEIFEYPIEGFTHQFGYSYTLRVLETNQTQDGEVIEDDSFVRYVLLEEISREGLPSQQVSSSTATTSTTSTTSTSSSSQE